MASEGKDYMMARRLAPVQIQVGRLETFRDRKRLYDGYFLREGSSLLSGSMPRRSLKDAEQDPEPSVLDTTKARIEELTKLVAKERAGLQSDSNIMGRAKYAAPVLVVVFGLALGPLGAAGAACGMAYIYLLARHGVSKKEKKVEAHEAELRRLEERSRLLQP